MESPQNKYVHVVIYIYHCLQPEHPPIIYINVLLKVKGNAGAKRMGTPGEVCQTIAGLTNLHYTYR